MKLSTLSSLFVLMSVISMIAIAPSAFAEDVTVTNAPGSATPGCEPNCFVPSTVTIEVGDTVTWDNTDKQLIQQLPVLQQMDQVVSLTAA